MNVLKLFFSFDAFNYLICKYPMHSFLAYPLAGLFSFIIQTGVFVGPIISVIIPNNWIQGYRILLGAIVGMFLSAVKDFFTDSERDSELQKIKEKLQKHDEEIVGLRNDIEYNKPFVYEPCDLPSPASSYYSK